MRKPALLLALLGLIGCGQPSVAPVYEVQYGFYAGGIRDPNEVGSISSVEISYDNGQGTLVSAPGVVNPPSPIAQLNWSKFLQLQPGQSIGMKVRIRGSSVMVGLRVGVLRQGRLVLDRAYSCGGPSQNDVTCLIPTEKLD